MVGTENPLLVLSAASPLPALDSTRLLARASFEVTIGQRAMPTWHGGTTQS
jgi:aspartate racemase